MPQDDGRDAATDRDPAVDDADGDQRATDASNTDEPAATGVPEDDGAAGDPSRRDLLRYGAVGLGALGVAGAGWQLRDDDPPDTSPEPIGTATPGGDGDDGADRARTLAARYAPTLYFGRYEQWFPTDPRRYAPDGQGVVDGFDALDGYTGEFAAAGEPPAPTVCYRVLKYPSAPLAVVQYWMYSVFDQFVVNFHWHDWELLQVFVDLDAGDPVLLSASAHSRRVPNNEFVGPEATGIRLLSEVGAHASATDVNPETPQFRRTDSDSGARDVTNESIVPAGGLVPTPLAYGLPRDEGGRLPYAVPELDGAPLYEHPDLPNVSEDDLIGDPLAVRTDDELSTPPSVPTRKPGPTFVHEDGDASTADYTYELVPMAPVAEAIDDFTGPQLSFEFAVPGFLEDAAADHLTSVGLPWAGERYDHPLADVTGTSHRRSIVDDYGLGDDAGDAVAAAGRPVTAVIEELAGGTDGSLRDDDAETVFGDDVTVSFAAAAVEAGCLLESEEPVAVPTVNGTLLTVGVEPGEHRLTVDGAGYAPHSERFDLTEDAGPAANGETIEPSPTASETPGDAPTPTETTDGTPTTTETPTASPTETATTAPPDTATATATPGIGGDPSTGGGRIALVRKREALKLRGEAAEGTEVARVRVADDFAGTAFDGQPPEDGRFAVYVHREGTYDVDLRDGSDRLAPLRIRPDEEASAGDGDADDGDAEPPVVTRRGIEPSLARSGAYLDRYLADAAVLADENIGGGTGTDLQRGFGNAADRARAAREEAPGQAGGTPGQGQSTETPSGDTPGGGPDENASEQAKDRLREVRSQLADVRQRVAAGRDEDLPDPAAAEFQRRIDRADRVAAEGLDL